MTCGGWIAMIIGVGGVVALLTWCLYKVLATPGSTERMHSQADIETPDIEKD